MRIAIFEATGSTGRELVAQGLAAGHQVVAYVRNPSKMGIRHPCLTMVKGQLTDAARIEQAVRGADAVISVLGPRADAKGKPITQGTRNILAAMEKHGVRRLVVTSTPSAPDPNDRFDLQFKMMIGFVKTVMRDGYEDIIATAEAIRASDRDWTIVRVPLLDNNPKSGQVRASCPGRRAVGRWLARADPADFMLQRARDLNYLCQAPVVSS